VLLFVTDHHHLKNYLRHKVAKHETEKKVKEKEEKQEDKPGESDDPYSEDTRTVNTWYLFVHFFGDHRMWARPLDKSISSFNTLKC